MDRKSLNTSGQLALQFGMVPILLKGKQPFIPGWNKTTREQAKSTFSKGRSGYNVGVLTGEASKIIVIDVEKDDLQSWDMFISEHGGLPKTLTMSTGRGGRHYYFEYTPEVADIRNGVKLKLPLTDGSFTSIDIRNNGGQVVWYDSIGPGGTKYFPLDGWLKIGNEIEIVISDMPQWLISAIKNAQNKLRR